jgi:sugar (pentulose or hexulose) kinase
MLSVGIDIGGSAVKAWLIDSNSGVLAEGVAPTPVIRRPNHVVEVDSNGLWLAVASALGSVLEASPRTQAPAALTVTSLRQGFVLLDENGEIGPAVLNSDRRGQNYLSVIRDRIGSDRLYETTGHWLAPELTLPKLLYTMDIEPDRWAKTRTVLFIHDWLIWRLTGKRACEVSFACAGQLADVATRDWAFEIMADLGIDSSRFPPMVESGATMGRVTRDAARLVPGLLAGTPVIAGGADTQMAVLGVDGACDGVITVVAGSSTPVQAATRSPLSDPHRRPWISTHLDPNLWAAETNVGYPGTMMDWFRGMVDLGKSQTREPIDPGASGVSAIVAHPHWTEEVWASKAPGAILGVRETTTPLEIASAFLEAHAFGIRSNVADLSAALSSNIERIILTGGGARTLSTILANVLNRPVSVIADLATPAAFGAARIVARALGDHEKVRVPEGYVITPTSDSTYDEAYERYLASYDMLHDFYSAEQLR